MTDTDEITIDDLRRADGSIDARAIQPGNSDNIDYSYVVSAATCANWRHRLLDGEDAAMIANQDGAANATVSRHARDNCDHGVDAPAVTYDEAENAWREVDP